MRALDSSCGELREVTARWDGQPDSVWRKRLARHIRDCRQCSGRHEKVVPAERLLVGLALVPVPVGFTLSLVFGGKTAVAATTAATTVGWSAKIVGALTKPHGGGDGRGDDGRGRRVRGHTAAGLAATPGRGAHGGEHDPPESVAHADPHALTDETGQPVRNGRRRRRPGPRPERAPRRAATPA